MDKAEGNDGSAPDRDPTQRDPLAIFFYLFEDPDYFYANSSICYHASKPLFWLSVFIQQSINILIVLGVTSLCLSTVDAYNPNKFATSSSDRPGNEDWGEFWDAFELLCVVSFTIDFIVRLCGALYRKEFPFFASQFLNWVDVVAIAPFYLELVLGDFLDLRFVRVIRLVRIIRALRSPKFMRMASVITEIVTEAAPALSIPVFFMLLAMVLFSCVQFYAEKGTHIYECMDGENHTGIEKIEEKWRDCSKDNPDWHHEWRRTEHYDGTVVQQHHIVGHSLGGGYMYQSIPEAFWWNLVTFTTVGYGDLYPTTTLGKLINSVTIVVGVFFLAMPLSIIGNSFVGAWGHLKFDEAVQASREAQKLDPDKFKLDADEIDAVQAHFTGILRQIAKHIDECQQAVPSGGQWDNRKAELKKVADEVTELWKFCEDPPADARRSELIKHLEGLIAPILEDKGVGRGTVDFNTVIANYTTEEIQQAVDDPEQFVAGLIDK